MSTKNKTDGRKEVHLALRIHDDLDAAIDHAIEDLLKKTGVRVTRSAIVDAKLREAFGLEPVPA